MIMVTKHDMEEYLAACESWVNGALKNYVQELPEGSVDIGSNPPPPPPPPPGTH